MIHPLVERFGRTGFALLASLIWALPMAAWAGSFDLSPADKTPFPGVALIVGFVMLAVWLFLLTRLPQAPESTRPHRLDLRRMSASERRWTLGLAAFATGLIGWLSFATTVDWSPVPGAVGSGKPGAIAFAAVLVAFPCVMLGGIAASWRKSTSAFRSRAGAQATEPAL
ncbi:MAG TPA: hypothetical protein VGG31_01720 [Candidatus Dormibacteraeota bacterium]|jgi:hypothetical protein